jgi:hypothetical protein
MSPLGLLALGLSAAGWGLTILTGLTLLTRGPDGDCQTACVQVMFFSGVGAGGLGLLFGLLALRQPRGRPLTYIALALALPLCAILAALILIGVFA